MKNTMTYAIALSTAIDTMKNDYPEVTERLAALRDNLAKRANNSENVRAKNAAKRAEMVGKIIPILRKAITADMTAKEIYAAAKGELPEDFTAPKVQNILLREMAPELIKTETKGKANTYRLA